MGHNEMASSLVTASLSLCTSEMDKYLLVSTHLFCLKGTSVALTDTAVLHYAYAEFEEARGGIKVCFDFLTLDLMVLVMVQANPRAKKVFLVRFSTIFCPLHELA
jgi:hypothetical protein